MFTEPLTAIEHNPIDITHLKTIQFMTLALKPTALILITSSCYISELDKWDRENSPSTT